MIKIIFFILFTMVLDVHAEDFPFHITRSVGYLWFKGEKGEHNFCTAFLVSEKYALTNQHCVSTQEVCQATTAYFYNDQNPDPNSFACEKWIPPSGEKAPKISPEELNNKLFDVALLEFKNTPGFFHGFVHISNQKIEDQERIWIPKFDPPSYLREQPLLSLAQCNGKAEMKDLGQSHFLLQFHFPTEISDHYPCSLKRGNSGSPILDKYGNLLAVFNAITLEKENTTIDQFLNNSPIKDFYGVPLAEILAHYPQIRK